MIIKDKFSCWIIAISLSLINLSNGWIWISFATISDFTSEFYSASLSQINWIPSSFFVVIVVLGFPIIKFIDQYGIKKVLIVASILNFFCAAIRALSSATFVPQNKRYFVLLFGSIFAAISQPLGLFSTTKLASIWFSPEKRGLANNVASMGNGVGIILGSLLSPLIVSQKYHIHRLNNFYLIPHTIILIFVLIAVYFSPSNDNKSLLKNISFIKKIKLCFGNRQFVLLNIAFAIHLGIFTSYSTLIQQILCPLGYSDFFSGLCGSLILGAGFPGSLVCLYIVNRTGSLVGIVKTFIICTACGIVAFSMVTPFSNQEVLIILSTCWMGFFGFGVVAFSFELAVETAYPAGEVITTGLLMLLSQVFGMIIISIGQEIATPASELSGRSVCIVKDIRNYSITNSLIAILGVINASVLVLCFDTKYNRLIMEKDLDSDIE